jgi:hypothetical protein
VNRVLVGKREVKRPLWITRRSLEYNIKMDILEDGGVGGDRIELA